MTRLSDSFEKQSAEENPSLQIDEMQKSQAILDRIREYIRDGQGQAK